MTSARLERTGASRAIRFSVQSRRVLRAWPIWIVLSAAANARGQTAALSSDRYAPGAFAALSWRNLGPDRGGRSIAVAGSPSRPLEYYFGATGGGLWKTTDGGTSFGPVTDGQIRSASVGAVAVAPSNPDVVHIGMGEAQLRGNAMEGDGVYKSVDGGGSRVHLGLEDTRAIARIRVHPRDPDVVYVAALNHHSAANEELGVYRSRDGGRTWKKILYRSPRAGAVDLAIDPSSPDVLYASLWQVYRNAFQLWSGGPESGLFRSTDGGDSWTALSNHPGFPGGDLGKIGVAVSPADAHRVYAVVEASAGGLYRSDDAGENWMLANDSRDLWQRAFYFNRLAADPADPDTVYVLNFALFRSTDGGKTVALIETPHADHHDLLFSSTRDRGQRHIYWKAADGSGTAERLLEGIDLFPRQLTRDGRMLVFDDLSERTSLHVVALGGAPKRAPLFKTEVYQSSPALSPDDRWLAYMSMTTDRAEVYVSPFPDVESGRWQISQGGGLSPLWSPDGRTLYFMTPDGRLMASTVRTEPSFSNDPPRELFHGDYLRSDGARFFDIAPDGKRFLMIREGETDRRSPAKIVLVQNWLAELARLVPSAP